MPMKSVRIILDLSLRTAREKCPWEDAASFRKDLKKEIRCVGVFVNETPEKMAETAARVPLDALQLHGG